MQIPADYEVQPISSDHPNAATCGHCGLSWDDVTSTGITPTPAGRCPFEAFHEYDDEDERDISPLQEAVALILASQIGPDPRMGGMADCYLVTLDDMDALRKAVQR